MATSAAFRNTRRPDPRIIPEDFLSDTDNPDYILHINLQAEEEYNMSLYEKGLEAS